MVPRIKSPQLYRLSYRPAQFAARFAARCVSLVYPKGSPKRKRVASDTDPLSPLRSWTTGVMS